MSISCSLRKSDNFNFFVSAAANTYVCHFLKRGAEGRHNQIEEFFAVSWTILAFL